MAHETAASGDADPVIVHAAEMLGGEPVLRVSIRDRYDVHAAIARGLPAGCVLHLTGHLGQLSTESSMRSLGMSMRTLQRRKGHPAERLTREQSARAWQLAEILTKASEVFGSQQKAERWLETPATGLNREMPIALLATPEGAKIVDDYLTRLDYGVYT